jgi:hypothetical protein
MRFFPTSSAMAAANSYTRPSIRPAARRRSATRSVHGVAAQGRNAARAAATASEASCEVPRGKRASSQSRSMGERHSNSDRASLASAPIRIGCSAPRRLLARPSASSNRRCSSSGGSNIVEYVSLNAVSCMACSGAGRFR